MAGTVTDPRFIAEAVIGVDWQNTEGEAVPGAPFTPAQFIVVQNLPRDPDPTYLRPNGTHGAIFERFDGDRIISQAFKVELQMWGGRFQIMPFLESVLSGQPTVAFADMTITGPQSANVTALSFIGARPHHNTSPFVSTPAASPTIFLDITGGAFPFTVDFYKDAALTNQVGTAVVAAAATPTAITAFGGSGLTGSITLAAPTAAGTANAALDKVIFPFANQYTRFFRIFYTDGDETIILSDCVCMGMNFESTENGELQATAQVMAKRKTVTAATTFTPTETELDLVIYSHSELTVTNDVGGTPATPVVDNFSIGIENNVLQYIGNSVTPQKLIKRGFTGIRGTLRGESADETMDLVRQARTNTAVATGFKDMTAAYLLSTKTLSFIMKKVRPRLAEPGVEEDLIGKTELEYDALYDGVTAPLSVEIDV